MELTFSLKFGFYINLAFSKRNVLFLQWNGHWNIYYTFDIVCVLCSTDTAGFGTHHGTIYDAFLCFRLIVQFRLRFLYFFRFWFRFLYAYISIQVSVPEINWSLSNLLQIFSLFVPLTATLAQRGRLFDYALLLFLLRAGKVKNKNSTKWKQN